MDKLIKTSILLILAVSLLVCNCNAQSVLDSIRRSLAGTYRVQLDSTGMGVNVERYVDSEGLVKYLFYLHEARSSEWTGFQRVVYLENLHDSLGRTIEQRYFDRFGKAHCTDKRNKSARVFPSRWEYDYDEENLLVEKRAYRCGKELMKEQAIWRMSYNEEGYLVERRQFDGRGKQKKRTGHRSIEYRDSGRVAIVSFWKTNGKLLRTRGTEKYAYRFEDSTQANIVEIRYLDNSENLVNRRSKSDGPSVARVTYRYFPQSHEARVNKFDKRGKLLSSARTRRVYNKGLSKPWWDK